MSVKIMSAIFETEFRDLPLPANEDGEKQRMAKASSLKLVLLAIADHANDEGESAYPGLTLLEKKTGMSRQGVIDIISALKYNGILFVSDDPSRLGTNNYTLNLDSFPCLKEPSQTTLLVKPLDYPSQATLLEVVKPLDSNHPLTIIKTSIDEEKKSSLENASLEWLIKAGASNEEIEKLQEKERIKHDATLAFEVSLSFNPLPWWSNSKWNKFGKFVIEEYQKDPKIFKKFADLRKSEGQFTRLPSNPRIYQNPELLIAIWPSLAFQEELPVLKRPDFLDEDESKYVPR